MARPKTDDPEVRAKIAAAAEELFAEHGYAGTTIRDIAARAQVNGAMIHYYFGNKEGLYHAIIESAASTVRGLLLQTASADLRIEERLTQFIRAYAGYLFSHPNLARILHRELISGGKHLKEIVQQPSFTNYTILRKALADSVKRGELREIDVDLAPISLLGMIIIFQILQPIISIALNGKGYDEEFVKRLSAHTVDLFLNGARALGRGETAKVKQ